MRIKKSSIASLINVLASTYIAWLETPHCKLWRLNKAIAHEIRNVYSSIHFEFAQIFRRDGVLALSIHDRFYTVFSSDLKNAPDATEVVFVRCFKGRFSYSHIRTPQDVYDYVRANPMCTYFVLSPHTIKVFRILDKIREDVYYLQNFFDAFTKHYLPVFFRNTLENLHKTEIRTCNVTPIVDNNDILVKSTESQCSRTYHIDLKCIGLFVHTMYTGASDEKLQFYTDMRYIFTKNVDAIRYSLNKSMWLEKYIKDVVKYLYSRSMISTMDLCAYPDFIPSLFPFPFVSFSTRQFKEHEMVRGGICFSNVLDKDHLVNLVNREVFKKYDDCLGTLYFTEFVLAR